MGRVFDFDLKGLDGWITFKFVMRRSASPSSGRFSIILCIIQSLPMKCTSSEVVPSLRTLRIRKARKKFHC